MNNSVNSVSNSTVVPDETVQDTSDCLMGMEMDTQGMTNVTATTPSTVVLNKGKLVKKPHTKSSTWEHLKVYENDYSSVRCMRPGCPHPEFKISDGS